MRRGNRVTLILALYKPSYSILSSDVGEMTLLFSAENQQVRIALRTGRWSIGKKVNEHDGAEYVKVKKGSCVSICDVLRSPCTCAVSRKTLERLAENRHCRLADQVPEIKDREMEKKRNGEEREKEKKNKRKKRWM